jgi:hypothetical protein
MGDEAALPEGPQQFIQALGLGRGARVDVNPMTETVGFFRQSAGQQ